jgi:hypothetical protein
VPPQLTHNKSIRGAKPFRQKKNLQNQKKKKEKEFWLAPPIEKKNDFVHLF